jgi:hypothetical protein
MKLSAMIIAHISVWILYWPNNSGARYLFHCQRQWEQNQKIDNKFLAQDTYSAVRICGNKTKQNLTVEARGSRVLSICTYDSIVSNMSTNDGWSYGNNMSKNKTH